MGANARQPHRMVRAMVAVVGEVEKEAGVTVAVAKVMREKEGL